MIAPHEADGVQEILRLLVARGFIYDIVKEVAHGQLQALLPNCFGRQWIVHYCDYSPAVDDQRPGPVADPPQEEFRIRSYGWRHPLTLRSSVILPVRSRDLDAS